MNDPFAFSSDEARQARDAVNSATEHGQRALYEAIGAAERAIHMATTAAERLVKESLDALRAQTGSYAEGAMHQLADGQRYVAESVKQRPVTFTLAGLGLGVLLGLVLSSRSKQKAPSSNA